MSKEIEALKTIKNFLGYNYCSVDLPNELKCVEQALQRLEEIDNTKPSEVLDCLEEEIKDLKIKLKKNIKLRDKLTIYQHRELENCLSRISKYENKLKQLNTIKQALLKAQENEKALRIIFKKKVMIEAIITLNLHDYNDLVSTDEQLTEEEFDLLKEVVR